MTWVRAKTPELMAGSRLLIINNLQADQAELLNPRIQAIRGKAEQLRTWFSTTQQCEQPNTTTHGCVLQFLYALFSFICTITSMQGSGETRHVKLRLQWTDLHAVSQVSSCREYISHKDENLSRDRALAKLCLTQKQSFPWRRVTNWLKIIQKKFH